MLDLPSNACCLGSGKRRTFDAGFGGAFDSDETLRDDEVGNTSSAGWQLLEERVDSNYLASPGLNERVQHVWGKRYIDDAILHRQDRPESGHPGGNGVYAGTGEGTWYHVTDAMFATAALLTPSGALAERVTFDVYGRGRHHWPADVNGDGAVTTTGNGNDLGVVSALAAGSGTAITAGGYRAECDINRDGTIDSSDAALVSSKSALAAGLISDASGADNAIGWQGYVFNPETRLYTVRNRTYEPVLSRWMQRDPAGYVDGMSLYEGLASSPTRFVDPFGLDTEFNEDGSITRVWKSKSGQRMVRFRHTQDGRVVIEAREGPMVDQWIKGNWGDKVVWPGGHTTDVLPVREEQLEGLAEAARVLKQCVKTAEIAGMVVLVVLPDPSDLVLLGMVAGDRLFKIGGVWYRMGQGAGKAEKLGDPAAVKKVEELAARKADECAAACAARGANPLSGTRYSDKVLRQMQPNPRTGRPDFHGFPREVDNLAGDGIRSTIRGADGIERTKIELPGSLNGRDGVFELILDPDGTVNHRLFRPKG